MFMRIATAGIFLSFATGAANAATEVDCLAMWKTADVNANGELTRDEDKAGYFAAAQQKMGRSDQAGAMPRDEFVKACQADTFAQLAKSPASPTGAPAASRDIGKGDLTASPNALSETDARQKLTEKGFKDVKDLKLDSKGIWQGTAVSNGERKTVSIDAQGDVVGGAKVGGTPKVAETTTAPTTTAQTTTAPPKNPPAPAAKPSPPSPVAESETLGMNSDPAGFPLWIFLLIGNAAALIGLSSLTAAGTSAMSGRSENPFV